MDTIWKVGRPTKWSPIVRSRLRRISGCSRFRPSGVVGQAAELGQVADEARGIIAAWNEDGPDEDSVTVQVRLDGEAGA